MTAAVLLIDLSALWWPAYKMTGGEDIATANRNTLARIHSLAGRYEHVGIACDSPISFRRELSADYKATRERDPVAKGLMLKLQASLRADGFALWQADGFEADDVLATAAHQRNGFEVVIATSDKDLLACVGPGVSIFHTVKEESFDAAAVQAKLGVRPDQIPDYLALIGDTADNVPGVRGCGPKHASRLLAELGSLDKIIENAETVNPVAVRLNLIAAIADGSLAMSRKLIALRRDVPGVNIQDALAPRVPKPTAAREDDYMNATEEMPPIEAPPAPEPPPAAVKAESKPQTALAVIEAELIPPGDPRFSVALEPRTFTQGKLFAAAAFDSRVYSNIPTAQAAWLVILAGRSLGLDAVSALQGAHIIKGRICWHAAVIIGRVIASGRAEYFEVASTTDKEATWVTRRHGRPERTLTWTLEDAKKAGLLGKSDSNWDKYPRTMLRWRCGVELARMVFPEVVANVYTPEEMGEGGEPQSVPMLGGNGHAKAAVEPPTTAADIEEMFGPSDSSDVVDVPHIPALELIGPAAIQRIQAYAAAGNLEPRDLAFVVSRVRGGGDGSGELTSCPASLEPEILSAIKAKVRGTK